MIGETNEEISSYIFHQSRYSGDFGSVLQPDRARTHVGQDSQASQLLDQSGVGWESHQ